MLNALENVFWFLFCSFVVTLFNGSHNFEQEGQHPLTGQRAANFRLLANQ